MYSATRSKNWCISSPRAVGGRRHDGGRMASMAESTMAHLSIRTTLLREFLTILLCPVAIGWYGFQRRTTFGSTCTWSFHLRFGHARTRLGPQASADVNEFAFPVGSGRMRRTSPLATGGNEGQQQKQSRNRGPTPSISHPSSSGFSAE
jgi:hypothetical protein